MPDLWWALLLPVTGLIGLWGGRASRRPAAGGAVCQCLHELAYHDTDTGQCHGSVCQRANGVDAWVRCTCRQYVGPMPEHVDWETLKALRARE